HLLRGLANSRCCGACDRRLADELRQCSGEGLLLGGTLAEFPVQALERQLESLGDRLRAEAFELRRKTSQLEKIVAPEQKARAVLDRMEDLGGRYTRRKGANRKELAYAEGAVRLGLHAVRTSAHLAAS